jgi:cytochrome c oxidase assembly protein subunit 15
VRRFHLSPPAYRRVTVVAAVLLGIIIVTGAAVRLTGSGLGCPDWPNCEPGSLTPKNADDVHALVEFVNRVFTGAVSVAVIVCVLGSLLRRPRRRDLTWLSVGLVAGVVGQAVVGGLTVLFHLRPEFVMAHFLLSLVLLTNAIVLVRRAGDAPRVPAPPIEPRLRALSWVLVVVTCAVVVTGTVVTATGPHGGDEDAERFGFDISNVARIHGICVVVFLALALATLALLRRGGAPVATQNRLQGVLLVAFVQAAIGYIQYFNDIPALLVGMHVAGATLLWTTVVWYHLGHSERRVPEPDPGHGRQTEPDALLPA